MKSSLTKEQEAMVPVYLKKWQDFGYRTETTDREKARAYVNFLYEKIMGMNAPETVIFLDSPMACQLAINLLKVEKTQLANQLRSQLNNQLASQLDRQLDNQLVIQLDNQLVIQLRSQLNSQLANQLRSQLRIQLNSQLRNQLANQLNSQLISQLETQKLEYFSSTVNSWYWTGYYAFYDFVLNELFPEKKPDFQLFQEFNELKQHAHFLYLFDGIAFVSDFPESITVDQSSRLHHETQTALRYRDGYGLYALKGIRVEPWVIETPKDEIDRAKVLAIKNTEERHAVMSHIGLAAFLKDLGAEEIHSFVGYKLYYLKAEGEKVGPYLYMQCPSTGREFLEGVGDAEKYDSIDPTIKTVNDALKWRAERASRGLMNKFNKVEEWEYRA